MADETARIRWHGTGDVYGPLTTGYAGGLKAALFRIFEPACPEHGDRALSSWLPGMADKIAYGTEDELKREAEEWLAGFAASLGAVFPDVTDWGVRFGGPGGDVQRYRDEADARGAKAEVEALVGARRGTVMCRETWTGPWTPAGEENDGV